MEPRTVIFMGCSGSGKGVQSEFLHKHLETKHPNRPILYVETGPRFRAFAKEEGYTADLIRETGEGGGRQADFLAVWAWGDTLIKGMTEKTNVIMDGAPRSLIEAYMVETAWQFYKRKPVIFFLDVSVEVAKARLRARGRQDDVREEDIENRLAWFERDVRPALNFFKEHSGYQFVHIDGEASPEDVHEAVRFAFEGKEVNE